MLRLACLALSSAAAVSGAALAQSTIHVPQDHPTIQQAIAAAADGDTVLVAPGTYVEQIDFLGKEIALVSSGGAAVTTIDSQGAELWIDHPHSAVVRMVSGEGPGALIEGFTITGGSGTFPTYDGTGVWCAGLSPTIRACVIEDNHAGGGVVGDAVIEDCWIRGNDALPYSAGGGVRGQPTILRCVIEENASGDRGGGLYATGPCTVSDTVFRGNRSGNGFDGYSGGGVFGPATLIRCEITFNEAGHHQSGGPPDTVGTGVDGAAALIHCTVAYNSAFPEPPLGIEDPSGGIRNVGQVSNSILYGNLPSDVAAGSSPTITYSIVGSGWSGPGVFSADPLFVAPVQADFHLQPGSPAVDAGDPASPPDPDGTIADLGPYPTQQAAAAVTLRNGTGVNPVCYQSSDLPLIGTTWDATVDGTLFPFTVSYAVVGSFLQPSPPIPTAFGELLMNPASPQVLALVATTGGGTASFAIPIPFQTALAGLVVPTQALVIGATFGLGNALDLTLGTF